MTFLDFCVLIPLCWYGFKGFKNGLIYEVASIVALILGVIIARHFSSAVAMLLPNVMFAQAIAFIILFVSVVLLVHVAAKAITNIIKLIIPDAVDHLFGLLFGVCKVLIVCSVVLFLLQTVDRRELLLKKEIKEKSVTYKYVEPIAPKAFGLKDLTTNA